MRSNRRLVLDVAPLVVWTMLIWVSRIRNIAEDDDLSGAGRTSSVAIAVLFVVLAAATAVILWRSRGGGLSQASGRFVVGFAVWTIGYWAIRVIEMLLDDHSGAFLAVHTALALVSWALAALAWRAAVGTYDGAMVRAQS